MAAGIESTDFLVIGGGVVGSAIALGLARAGERVIMLDEADGGFNASRGNYGLIWLQGKGRGCPAYVAWLRLSARKWQAYAEELKQLTGVDVGYRATGGISLALSAAELQTQIHSLRQIAAESAIGFDYTVLEPDQLARFYPQIGAQVQGGIFCPEDATVDPLRLLFAQYEALRRLGGRHLHSQRATRIRPLAGGGFEVDATGGRFASRAVIVAAGLGTEALARDIGCTVPLQPIQGQLMITEKTTPLFEVPTLHARQMPSGGVLLGLSHDDRGLDATTDPETLRNVAARCVAALPFLARLNVVRAWAALRIMTPDGWPVYAMSTRAPGGFAVASHSGVTLAAAHATDLADALIAGTLPDSLGPLRDDRFHA